MNLVRELFAPLGHRVLDRLFEAVLLEVLFELDAALERVAHEVGHLGQAPGDRLFADLLRLLEQRRRLCELALVGGNAGGGSTTDRASAHDLRAPEGRKTCDS